MKECYPPLLAPGFHEMDLGALHGHCVGGIGAEGREHRQKLFDGFTRFVSDLVFFTGPCTLWVDGSFVTEKPLPEDVDLVMKAPAQQINDLSDAQKAILLCTFSPDNHAAVKARYGCDAYFVVDGDPDAEPYWADLFGFDYKWRPKGIAVIHVGGAT